MTRSFEQLLQQIFPHPDRFGELIGYQVEELSEEGFARVSLRIEGYHISPSGVVHGGVLSTLADYAMGASIFGRLQPGQLCSTIEFKINYLAPVRLGELLIGSAQTIYFGRSHAISEAELLVEQRKVAKTIGTYNLYWPRQNHKE